MKALRTFGLDGEWYDVPDDEVEKFKAEVPRAQEVHTFRHGDETYDVPLDQVEAFKVEAPEAERVRQIHYNGETYDVPESKRNEFFNIWRTEQQGLKRLGRRVGDVADVAVSGVRGAVEGAVRGVAAGALEVAGGATEAVMGVVRPVMRGVGLGKVADNQAADYQAWREMTARVRGTDGERENGFFDELNRGAGAAAEAVGKFVGMAPVLGALPAGATMPALGVSGALEAVEAGGGVEEAAAGALGGVARGMALGGIGATGAPIAARMLAGGGMFGAMRLAEGGSAEEALVDAVMGAGLAGMSGDPGSWQRARENVGEALRPVTDSNWWRKLTIAERGLVVRAVDNGQSAEVLREMGAPVQVVERVQARVSEGERIRAALRRGERGAFEEAQAARRRGMGEPVAGAASVQREPIGAAGGAGGGLSALEQFERAIAQAGARGGASAVEPVRAPEVAVQQAGAAQAAARGAGAQAVARPQEQAGVVPQVSQSAEPVRVPSGGKTGLAPEEPVMPQGAWAVSGDAAPEVLAAAERSGAIINNFPLEEIKFDPLRFQYKLGAGQTGATGSLTGVKKYDPVRGGVLAVWRDPADSKVYVVNGHNRASKARELGVKGHAVQFLQSPDAAAARAYGALINISEGRGTVIDAAKFFRDSSITPEKIEELGLPLSEARATRGLALSRLTQSLFDKVVQGEIDEGLGAVIGEELPEAQDQLDMMALLKGRKLSQEVVREIAEIAKGAPKRSDDGQMDLFGQSEAEKKLLVEKARVSAAVNKRLSRDKNLFARVASTDAAARLGAAGNVIDPATNREISREAETIQLVFQQLKHSEMSPILNKAAKEVENGKTVTQAVETIWPAIRAAVDEALGRAVAGSGGGREADGGVGDVAAGVAGSSTAQEVSAGGPDAGGGFSLESLTVAEQAAEAERLAAQEEARAARQEMLERQAAPLVAGSEDATAQIPGLVEPDNLFDAADQRARVALGLDETPAEAKPGRGGVSGAVGLAGERGVTLGEAVAPKPGRIRLYRGDPVAFDRWDSERGALISFTRDRGEAAEYARRRNSVERVEAITAAAAPMREFLQAQAEGRPTGERTFEEVERDVQAAQRRIAQGDVGEYDVKIGEGEIASAVEVAAELRRPRFAGRAAKYLASLPEHKAAEVAGLLEQLKYGGEVDWWQNTTVEHKDVWQDLLVPYLSEMGWRAVEYPESGGGMTVGLFAAHADLYERVDGPPKPGRGGVSGAGEVSGVRRPGYLERGEPAVVEMGPDDPQYTVLPIGMPEMVDWIRQATGEIPKVVEVVPALKGMALGAIRTATGEMWLRRDLFRLLTEHDVAEATAKAKRWVAKRWVAEEWVGGGWETAQAAEEGYTRHLLQEVRAKRLTENPKLAAQVLAHEVGHWIGSMPDGDMSRGNILGHMAALHGYTRQMLSLVPPNAAAGLDSKERAKLRRQAEKAVGRRPEPGAARRTWAEAVKAEYQQLVAAAAEERGLVTLEDVRGELEGLIAWWHGTEEMPEYFAKPSEMYADAFSVLVNNPAAVRQRAPTYMRLWLEWLGARPEEQARWEQYQQDVAMGRIGDERDRRQIEGMKEAEAAHEAQLRAKGVLSNKQVWRMTLGEFWSSWAPVKGVIKDARSAGHKAEADALLKAMNDDMYRHVAGMAYMMEVQEHVGKLVFADAGASYEEWNLFLQNRHIAENRQDIASMLGMNPAAANDSLARQQERVGEKAWEAMWTAQQLWHGLRMKYNFRTLEAREICDEALLKEVMLRSAYTHVAAVDTKLDPLEAIFNGMYGAGVGGYLHKQQGFLGVSRFPWQATLEFDRAWQAFLSKTHLKNVIDRALDVMGDPLYKPGGETWNAELGRMVPVVGRNERASTIASMRNGKAYTFWAPQEIVDFVNNNDSVSDKVVARMLNIVLRSYKGTLTFRNYGFPIFNNPRDRQDWERGLPGWKAPGVYRKYARRAKPIVKSILKGEPTPEAIEAMNERIMVFYPRGIRPGQGTFRQDVLGRLPGKVGRVFKRTGPQTAQERLVYAYGLDPRKMGLEQSDAARAWDWLKQKYGNLIERGELTKKVAGWLYLRDVRPDYTLAELQDKIVKMAGSPNLVDTARKLPYMDSLTPFIGPWQRGLESFWESMREEPVRVILTALKESMMTKLFRHAVRLGLLTTVLTKLFGKRGTWFGKQYELMQEAVPQYYRDNYATRVIWWDPTDSTHSKVIFDTRPLSEVNRVAGTLAMSAFDDTDIAHVLSFGADQLPGLNPVLVLGSQWQQILTGQEPRGIGINKTQVTAGAAIGPMAKHTFNTLSGGMFGRIPREGIGDTNLSPLEKFLRLPVISNTLGRRIRISNKGYDESRERRTRKLDKRWAQERKQAWSDAIEWGKTGKLNADAQRKMMQGAMIMRGRPKGVDPTLYMLTLTGVGGEAAYYSTRLEDYMLDVRMQKLHPTLRAMQTAPWPQRLEAYKDYQKELDAARMW